MLAIEGSTFTNRLLDQIISGSVLHALLMLAIDGSTFNRVNQKTVFKKHDGSGLPRHYKFW